jgi:hypothetical protein
MPKNPPAFERDLPFFRTVREFRNAVERMMVRRGQPIDVDHTWWGFGEGRRRHPPDGGSGLAGSRVPRRPSDDSGGAVVELAEPEDHIGAD